MWHPLPKPLALGPSLPYSPVMVRCSAASAGAAAMPPMTARTAKASATSDAQRENARVRAHAVAPLHESKYDAVIDGAFMSLSPPAAPLFRSRLLRRAPGWESTSRLPVSPGRPTYLSYRLSVTASLEGRRLLSSGWLYENTVGPDCQVWGAQGYQENVAETALDREESAANSPGFRWTG